MKTKLNNIVNTIKNAIARIDIFGRKQAQRIEALESIVDTLSCGWIDVESRLTDLDRSIDEMESRIDDDMVTSDNFNNHADEWAGYGCDFVTAEGAGEIADEMAREVMSSETLDEDTIEELVDRGVEDGVKANLDAIADLVADKLAKRMTVRPSMSNKAAKTCIDALKVIALSDTCGRALQAADPKALEQVRAALKTLTVNS